jgi:hypothetical protein
VPGGHLGRRGRERKRRLWLRRKLKGRGARVRVAGGWGVFIKEKGIWAGGVGGPAMLFGLVC